MESELKNENFLLKNVIEKTSEKKVINETKERGSNKEKSNNKSHIKENKNGKIDSITNKNEEDYIGLWKCWKEHPPIKLPSSSQISLMGWSVAALRTNFYIKELGLMLDAGLSSPTWTINHLLITHCHSDHCANLPFHLYSHKSTDKIKIYVPKGIERHIKEFIESAYLLSSHTFPEEENIKREELHLYNFYELLTVEPGNNFPIQIKKATYGLEIFKCYHQVPCVGYGVYDIRKKLKEEYSKLSGKEIGELRRKGVEINYNLINKMFVYLGDTGKEIFENKEWEKIAEYPTIIIECTFIFKEEKEQALKTYHIHWDFIEPIVDKYKNNTFILIHFSQRYDKSEIKKFFEDKNKNNVIPWV